MNTMYEGYEIPEKEVAPNKKLEKEKQSSWYSALIDSKWVSNMLIVFVVIFPFWFTQGSRIGILQTQKMYL